MNPLFSLGCTSDELVVNALMFSSELVIFPRAGLEGLVVLLK